MTAPVLNTALDATKCSSYSSAQCIQALLTNPASLQLRFLAEGAANIIYRVSSTDPGLKQHDNCCVMRMRKDLDFTQPCNEVLTTFKTRIVPLFAPHYEHLLMPQVLCPLTEEMVQDANLQLSRMEENGSRPDMRKGVFHPLHEVEDRGVLMSNLNRGSGTQLIEFKPKWLVQSPSASANARRCRTCALNAVRRMKGKTQGRGDSGFCPMDLLVDDNTVLSIALQNIFPFMDESPHAVAVFKEKVQPALFHLRTLQQRFDKVGLQDFQHPDGKDLSVAMALRDCSVFLNVDAITLDQAEMFDVVDVKFADLDLKATDGGKLEKWASMEDHLISSGAYVKSFEPMDNCALWRVTAPE